eukprot:5847500-Amphidinium_carterae.1
MMCMWNLMVVSAMVGRLSSCHDRDATLADDKAVSCTHVERSLVTPRSESMRQQLKGASNPLLEGCQMLRKLQCRGWKAHNMQWSSYFSHT